MNYLDHEGFGKDQKWLLHLRVTEKLSYRQVQAAWEVAYQNTDHEFISPSAIKTCFRRSALMLYWEKGKLYGNEPFLSEYDLEQLKDYIKNRTKESEPIDSFDLLTEALFIRKERQKQAIQFLKEIKCDLIADDLEQEELEEPVRSWINSHLNELESSIKAARIVDNDRYYSCSPEILNSYFNIARPLLTKTHPALIFGGDETHLDPKIKKKYIIPNEVREFMVRSEPASIPHFSVMLANNCIGQPVPPFIIIPNLEKCPKEAEKYIETGQIWACSSESGWQNRNSFLIWTLNFINWLSCYRLQLDPEIRDQTAVLILDGHNSRENPLSLYFLKSFNIEVLILPAHTTHLLQIFDVILARKFKKKFSKLFSKMFINQKFTDGSSMASVIRECVFSSLLQSWNESCTKDDCENAAKITGTFPFNTEIVLNSTFVHELTNEEKDFLKKKRRQNNILNINGKIITNYDTLNEINQTIFQKVIFKHLCVTDQIDYIKFCSDIGNSYYDINVFSNIHYYMPHDSPTVHF